MRAYEIFKFPMILLIMGGIFFLLGISGQVTYNQVTIGSNDLTMRILLIVVGIICIIFSYYTYHSDKNNKNFVTKEKQNKEISERILSSIGKWSGYILSQYNDFELKSPVIVEMFISDNIIKFNANIKLNFPDIDGLFPDTREHFFNLEGEADLSYEKFIRLKYNHTDKNICHLGIFFLELNSIGDRITGSGVGFGAISQQTFNQKMFLEKVK